MSYLAAQRLATLTSPLKVSCPDVTTVSPLPDYLLPFGRDMARKLASLHLSFGQAFSWVGVVARGSTAVQNVTSICGRVTSLGPS